MKKTLIALAVLAFAGAASAQQAASSYVANHGNISNTVQTSASSNGIGSSYSAATGNAAASGSGYAVTTFDKNGNPCVTTQGAVAIGGTASTSNSGTAFNISTGNGTGSASTRGWADADVVAGASYYGPAQWVSVAGSVDAGHQNNAFGTDISVVAGPNTGGFAAATTTGSFAALGAVGSTICSSVVCNSNTVTKSVFGGVSDTKSSVSTAVTGTMVVNGNTLNQAPSNAQGSTIVNVTGGFGDPV